MYQVNASYKVVSVAKIKRGAIAKFFGASEEERSEKGGTVQFTADSITEGLSKLQYLVQDVSTVTDLSFKRL